MRRQESLIGIVLGGRVFLAIILVSGGGMGGGDMKLGAMMGAFLGWKVTPDIFRAISRSGGRHRSRLGRNDREMVHRRLRRLDTRGFTIVEVLVVVAIFGVLAVLSLPQFVSYYRSSVLKGAAQEVTTLLNGARQLAIRQNSTVCFKIPTTYTTQIQYQTTGAATCDTVYTGPGTDGNGNVTLSNNMQAKGPATLVNFTYLGASNGSAGTPFRVCNQQNNTQHAEVEVSTSGRITTTYLNTAC